jgi:hypothetical protein
MGSFWRRGAVTSAIVAVLVCGCSTPYGASGDDDDTSAPSTADKPGGGSTATTNGVSVTEDPDDGIAEVIERASPADPPVVPAPGEVPMKPRCDVKKPFAAPRLVAGVSGDANTSNARLTGDELSIFFMRTLPAGSATNNEILVATRADRTAAFDGAKVVTEVASTSNEGSPSLSADGLTMYLHTNRTGGPGGYDIYVSRRASMTAAWGKPVLSAAVSSASTEFDPFARPDGKMIVFASNRTKNFDLYRSSLGANGALGAPTPITELNTTADEANPTLTADGLALYFSRMVGTSKDVFVARRATLADPFGPATKIEELSTAQQEWPSWISADECVLYLTVEVAPKKEVYVAERPL